MWVSKVSVARERVVEERGEEELQRLKPVLLLGRQTAIGLSMKWNQTLFRGRLGEAECGTDQAENGGRN
jgi:hypothetical protein